MSIFQIPDIQSCLFVTKMTQLNKNSLFWNIYEIFKGKALFGPYFDQGLLALINTLGPECCGFPPEVPVHAPLTPITIYTLPPPPRSVLFTQEVIDRAQKLDLHPDQEYMRYELAQYLTHDGRKHNSKGVFSNIKKLGSKRC